ncbi:hypothetical protein [Methylobacterium sp. J-092]|uniref:hypothetical protein n=1 Tax=Methylobacterium sp. J-092 TaxID=2836667 RepID=UPI001FB91170|nr:hypothetical protein [Methylobacterium sp. J-092]MCJ2009438.1 hypothetical protein [Methylobacterium sp. J-092]
MVLPTLGVTSIREISIDVTPNVRRVSYKRLGRFKPARAILLPNAPADLKTWLSDRLGAIEWIRFENEQLTPSQEATAPASPQRAAPLPHAADYDPALVARYSLVARREPDAARLAPIRAEVIRFDPAAPISFPPLIAGRLGLMRAAEATGRVAALELAE